MDSLYPGYGFSSHVGYITPTHSRLVRERGPCAIHRRSFQALCYLSEEEAAARLSAVVAPGLSGRARNVVRCRTTGCAATGSWPRTRGPQATSSTSSSAVGATVVFCEVKAKRDGGFGDPLEMVTAEKMRRGWSRAAETWLAAHPELRGCEARFDVVAERNGRLERVANAF